MELEKLKNIYICFPGGKHKALTMSFDDGKQEDRRLVELFNRYGIKGTFNLNSGVSDPRRIPAEEYAELYKGHEIACHTSTHPTIARSPIEQVARQVLENRAALERAAGYPVRGLAYPNGSYSPEIMELLPLLGIRYARTVTSTGDFAMPENWLAWNPTCHFRNGLQELAERFLALYKWQYLYLMYVWGHSYELPEQGGWEIMERFCETVAGREDIWFASNIEIADYMEQAERLRFTIDGDLAVNPGSGSVWLNVNGEPVEIPGGQSVILK